MAPVDKGVFEQVEKFVERVQDEVDDIDDIFMNIERSGWWALNKYELGIVYDLFLWKIKLMLEFYLSKWNTSIDDHSIINYLCIVLDLFLGK